MQLGTSRQACAPQSRVTCWTLLRAGQHREVPIRLERLCSSSASVWEALAQGSTNADGRIGDLLPPSDSIEAGTYRYISLVQDSPI